MDFVVALAKAEYEVVIRPHPQSFSAEPDFIASCQKVTEPYSNVRWDCETIGSVAMEESDVLISDTSSIRFDYAFLYGKPVITLDIPRGKQTEYEGQFQSEIWTDVAAGRLGRVLGHDDISALPGIVKDILTSGSTSVREFRDQTISNLGTSAKAIVDILMKEVASV